jgi:phospholipid-binding lipoprotein MlaA
MGKIAESPRSCASRLASLPPYFRVAARRLFGLVLSALSTGHLALAEGDEIKDPWEGMNRGIFWFNDQLDVYLLEPVARGYDWAMPERAKKGVVNFFENLSYPSYLVSDVVQGKMDQVGLHTGRFLINTTIGIGGLIDVAKEFGLEKHSEDFGIALAYHGVPAGPYLVLPLYGPSNVRDAVGLAVDSFLDPIAWLSFTGMKSSTRAVIQGGLVGLRIVRTRAGLIQAIETAKESSLDYYLFMQSAYYQFRHGLLTDGKESYFDTSYENQSLAEGLESVGEVTDGEIKGDSATR